MYLSTIIPIKIIFKLYRTKTYKRYVLLCIKSLISLHADTIWIRQFTRCHLKIKQKENLNSTQCMLILFLFSETQWIFPPRTMQCNQYLNKYALTINLSFQNQQNIRITMCLIHFTGPTCDWKFAINQSDVTF